MKTIKCGTKYSKNLKDELLIQASLQADRCKHLQLLSTSTVSLNMELMYSRNSSSTSRFSKTNRRKKREKDDNNWKSLDLLSKRGEKRI